VLPLNDNDIIGIDGAISEVDVDPTNDVSTDTDIRWEYSEETTEISVTDLVTESIGTLMAQRVADGIDEESSDDNGAREKVEVE
jgi:hypothetical protein